MSSSLRKPRSPPLGQSRCRCVSHRAGCQQMPIELPPAIACGRCASGCQRKTSPMRTLAQVRAWELAVGRRAFRACPPLNPRTEGPFASKRRRRCASCPCAKVGRRRSRPPPQGLGIVGETAQKVARAETRVTDCRFKDREAKFAFSSSST
eukprot:9288187-Alexandrium_andersonii.AAC.1